MSGRPREEAKFWRAEDYDDLELLHATYITHVFDRHFHEEYVVGVVVRSEYSFECEAETVIARRGQIILINPGEIHSGYAINESGWTYRALYPSVNLMRQIAEEVSAQAWMMPFFPKNIVDDDIIARTLVNFHRVMEFSTAQLERDVTLRTALGALIARYADNRPFSILRPGREREAVQRVRGYLEAHYMENPSLDDLAQLAGLSPWHLLRVFREETGLPPHTYLTQLRIRRAKQRLKAGDTIADVAAATGFSDQSHLTRRFKRIIGVTPGQYIASI